MQLKAKQTGIPTYTATIYCGARHGYGTMITEEREFNDLVQDYVDGVGLCVTVTKTIFKYTRGDEPGYAVGLINYPRFPSSPSELREKALELAELLMVKMCQNRVTVVFPDDTIMLQDDDEEE